MRPRIAACVFLALGGTLQADDVTLTGGRMIQGEILEEGGDTLVVKAAFGILRIPRDQVVRIDRKPYASPPKPPPVAPATVEPAPPKPPAPPAAQGPDEAEVRARIETAVAALKSRRFPARRLIFRSPGS